MYGKEYSVQEEERQLSLLPGKPCAGNFKPLMLRWEPLQNRQASFYEKGLHTGFVGSGSRVACIGSKTRATNTNFPGSKLLFLFFQLFNQPFKPFVHLYQVVCQTESQGKHQLFPANS